MKKKSDNIRFEDIVMIGSMLISAIVMLIICFSIEAWARGEASKFSGESVVSTKSLTDCTEESFFEKKAEPLEEPSIEESSDEISEKSADESADESAVEVGGALELSEEEFRLLCYVAYAEAGSEVQECLIGTIWNMKNGAENAGGDYISYLTYPARYSVVQEDGTVLSGDGIVTDQMISEDFENLVRKVLSGEIPDPTRGYECYVAYELMDDYTDPDAFAQSYEITDYVVLGKHIFFPEEQWPEAWT